MPKKRVDSGGSIRRPRTAGIVKGFGRRHVVTYPPSVRAGVRKPPRKEPAGRWRAVCRLWGFDRAAVQRGLGWAASLRVDRLPSLRIGRRRCPRRCDPTTVGGIGSAFAGTGATVLRRRERPVPAVGWCNEAVTVV